MIFLAGGSGYFGSKILASLIKRGGPFINLKRYELGFYSELSKTVNFFMERGSGSRNIFINAAGYTGKPNVDAGEIQKGECIKGNVGLPVIISNVCQELNIPMLHISTGCIYTGHDKIWSESDPPNFSFRENNCSFYSGSKALAEELLETNEKCYVLRPRIPFDNDIKNPRSFLYKIIQYPKLMNSLNSVTHIEGFTKILFRIIDEKLPYGKYNIVCPQPVEIKVLVELLDKYGYIKKEDKKWFASKEEFLQSVKCPRSECVLDTKKIEGYGIYMPNSLDTIKKILKHD